MIVTSASTGFPSLWPKPRLFPPAKRPLAVITPSSLTGERMFVERSVEERLGAALVKFERIGAEATLAVLAQSTARTVLLSELAVQYTND